MKNKTYVGCSGFAQGYWKGFFYPENLSAKDYLSYYASQLNAVEINSTFYRKPTSKTLEKWFHLTGENFKFFIKIPKTITHLKKLSETKEETTVFCTHIHNGLQEKLAGFLFQLPPSFHYSEENLNKVVETINGDFINVVEFRHQSWWNNEVFEKLKENKIIFCGVSFPKDISDEVIVNSEAFLYYRFHGVPVLFKSEYSEDQLEIISKKIENFKGTSYLFFNNTWGTAGIKNALELQKILK